MDRTITGLRNLTVIILLLRHLGLYVLLTFPPCHPLTSNHALRISPSLANNRSKYRQQIPQAEVLLDPLRGRDRGGKFEWKYLDRVVSISEKKHLS